MSRSLSRDVAGAVAVVVADAVADDVAGVVAEDVPAKKFKVKKYLPIEKPDPGKSVNLGYPL